MTTALYRRYRPDTFDQVIGQEHVTEPLKAALRANRVTHAYLFSGPRGCGKTTSARILARCLNCAQGPTDTPCGQCESCRELATGGPGSLDVVEIDAASHGGVDDARDLRERATFAPVRDRYKIFIIDEAHMVTNQGFNALLKLVEEPPEHVKFVFATTEPERVIGTIRSRTHHYPFRLVPPDVLGPYLTSLCAEEHVGVGEGVLTLVMRAGGGSVRDTLSVLDQLMAGAIDGQVTYQTAVALLGYTDSALLDESVDALAGGDGAAAFRVVERMVESGHDPRRFVEDLLQRLRDLLIIAVAGDGARDVLADTPHDQFERMQRQAQNWGPHGLSRAADLTDEALRAMTGATSPRLQLELLVGRILVPAPTAAPAPGPVQGTVGMTGGGAPRQASPGSTHEASSGRFGAREAREALARKKQERTQASAPSQQAAAPASSSPAPAAQGVPAWGSGPDWSAPEQSAAPAQAAPQEAPHREAAQQPRVEATQEHTQPEPRREAERSRAEAPARETAPAQADSRAGARAQQRLDSAAPQRAEASAHTELSAPAQAPASGRDADMLRGRWNEVVERLSSISRVTWSMVGGNAQLGAVDGTRVVLLFPVDAMVNAFARGSRAADVEKAIREVTGLTVTVSAQVGQASGGSATTGPSAQASRAGGRSRQPGGWVSEPPPFDEAAAQAAPHDEPEPEEDGWPAPAPVAQSAPVEQSARAPQPDRWAETAAEPAPEQDGWPAPAPVAQSAPVEQSARAPQPDPEEDNTWPEPASVTPRRREQEDAPAAPRQWENPARQEAPAPQEAPAHRDGPVLPERAARALAEAPAQEQQRPAVDTPAAPRKRSFTVFTYPGDPEPTDANEETANGGGTQASSPVFDDAPIEPASYTPSTPTGWGDPVVISGGASVNFDDGADSWAPRESDAPVDASDVTPISAAPSEPVRAPAWLAAAPEPAQAPAPGFGDPQPPRAAGPAPDAPLTGRAAAEAALREKAQRQAAVASARTHAADDDSASIDDDNIENSQTIGLAAVLEILGGRVIEEKMTEGGY